MPDLIQLLNIAVEHKPKMGESCNHCGYCCLSEPCEVGKELTGSIYGRCELLITEGEKHYCQIAVNEAESDSTVMRDTLGIGVGCCAETQTEAMMRITHEVS